MPITKLNLATQSAGTLPAVSVPNPSATTLGGVESTLGVAHQWISSITVLGVPVLTQPAFGDISGTLSAAQMVALSGDVTNVAGSAAATVKGINGVTMSSLGTGLVKNTTATGVPVIAVAGTDYVVPSGSITGNAGAVGGITITGTPGVGNVLTATSTIAASWSAPTGSINFVDNEVVGGTLNGSNVTFTLANTPTSGSVSLFLNGDLLQSGTGNDYTISGLTITMLAAPASTDKLLANYRH